MLVVPALSGFVLFSVSESFACMYVYLPLESLVPEKASRGHQTTRPPELVTEGSE